MSLPPRLYSAWQQLFVGPKLLPVMEQEAFQKANSIVELGCGPGLNYPMLKKTTYLGLDLNQDYVDYANQHHGPFFQTRDVADPSGGEELGKFDVVLAHSLLHHLSDEQLSGFLKFARKLRKEDGTLIIADALLPASWNLARVLAGLDDGKYIRPKEKWQKCLLDQVEVSHHSYFPLRLFGITAYEMFLIVCK